MNSKSKLLVVASGLLLLLVLVYSNHFNNGFYFDDAHTVVDNEYIRDLGNWKLFFTSNETSSTLQTNREYRPIVTLLNAIDYRLAGNQLNSKVFHIHIFFWYVITLFLLFFFIRHLIRKTVAHRWSDWFALFMTAFYGFHTGNAETLNYIIARSDSFSTLCVITTMLLFIHKPSRKYHLYLITLVLGLWSKQTALMLVPILFTYILLFEEEASVWEVVTFNNKKAIKNLAIKIAPAAIVGIGLFLFNIIEMTPTAKLFKTEATSRWTYFMTQQVAISRYIGNFFLPVNLSTDTTIPDPLKEFINHKVLYGLLLNLILGIGALIMTSKKQLRIVSFGILWFYFALAPTSSFHALGQISNDHRIFFPYIGLAIATGWLICLMILRYETRLTDRSWKMPAVAGLATLIILSYGWGVYQRNKVWSSSETLWADAVKKCPENGRALMNYGLTKMGKGEYEEAGKLFDQAEQKMPYWAYIHINQGILKNATGDKEGAEISHKKAIQYQGFNPEGYYHYARFLNKNGRPEEALEQLRIALEKSPGHSKSKNFIKLIEARQNGDLDQIINNPTSTNYLNQSLAFYKTREFDKSIQMANKALELDSTSAEAYNNICAAYCGLKQWEKAIEACNKALEIKPEFQRAKNNLRWAVGELEK